MFYMTTRCLLKCIHNRCSEADSLDKSIHLRTRFGHHRLRNYGQYRYTRKGCYSFGISLNTYPNDSNNKDGKWHHRYRTITKRAFHTSWRVEIENNSNKSSMNNQKPFSADKTAPPSSPKTVNSKDKDDHVKDKLPSQPASDSLETQDHSNVQDKPTTTNEGRTPKMRNASEPVKLEPPAETTEPAVDQSGEECVDAVPAVPDMLGYVPTPFKKYRRSKYWNRERITNFKSFLSSAGRYFVDEEVDILRSKTREFIRWSIFPPASPKLNKAGKSLSEGGGGSQGGNSCVQQALNFLRDPWLEKVLELNAYTSLTSIPSENQSRNMPQSKIGFSLQSPSSQEAFVMQMVRELASKHQANFVDFDFLFLRTTMNWFIESQSTRVLSKEIQVSLEQFLQDLQRNDDDFILFLDDFFHLIEEATAMPSKEKVGKREGRERQGTKEDVPLKYVVLFRNLGVLRNFPHHMIRERLKTVKVPMLFIDLTLEPSADRAMIVPIGIVTPSPPSSNNNADEDEYGVVPSGTQISPDMLQRELFSKFKNLMNGKGAVDTLKGYRTLFGDEAIDVTKRPLSNENAHSGSGAAGSVSPSSPYLSPSQLHPFLMGMGGKEGSRSKETTVCEAIAKAHEVLTHDVVVRQNIRNLQACLHAHHIELLGNENQREPRDHLGRSIIKNWLESDIQWTVTGRLLVHVNRFLKKDEVSRIVSLTVKYHDVNNHQQKMNASVYEGASGDAASKAESQSDAPSSVAEDGAKSPVVKALTSELVAPVPQSGVQQQTTLPIGSSSSALQPVPNVNPFQEVSNDFLRLLGEEQLNFMFRQSILIKYLHLALELEIGVTHYMQSPDLMNVDEESFIQAVDRAYQDRMATQQREFDMTRDSHHYDMLKARIQHSNLSNNERRIFDTYVQPSKIGTTFDDIASLEHAKEELMSFIVPIKMPVFQSNKLIKNPLGILLYGPPGTGKTMLARAVARSANANFIHISASTIVSKWLGESESNAAAVFSLAKKLSPCIIFIDEVDGLLNTRDASEHESSRRVKNEFFSGWDGLLSISDDPNVSVTVIAATNRPFDLDAAALRRLPHRVLIPLPDKASRIGIFTKILRHVSIARGSSEDATSPLSATTAAAPPPPPAFESERLAIVDQLSDMTEGYSGSDIKSLCTRAALQLVRDFMSDQDYKALQNAESTERENYDSLNSDTLHKLTQLASTYASRPLTLIEFRKALFEIGKSVDHRSRTQLELKKWHEIYGSKSYDAKSKTNRMALGFQ